VIKWSIYDVKSFFPSIDGGEIILPIYWLCILKISNLKKAIFFFKDILGMHVLRHEEFNSGCEASCNGVYQRPWSKTMIGYGNEIDHFVFELTYNYGISNYERGDDLRHITIHGKDTILERAKSYGVEPVVEDGQTYLLCPVDGYRFCLVNAENSPRDPVVNVSINVSNIQRSEDYYVSLLEMTLFSKIDTEGQDKFITVGYNEELSKLELVERVGKSRKMIDHAEAYGRVAIAIKDINVIYQKILSSGDKVLHHPVKLDTPGKATVEVVILQDRDDYEICFVGEEGFNSLSLPIEGNDFIDWEKRLEDGADDE